jgi:DNA replication protein DnaC
MNNQATLEKMHQMKLYGMARAFRTALDTGMRERFTADELLAHLIDAEWDERHNRATSRLIKKARFRYQAFFEQIDFHLPRNLDKNMILRFSDCSWVERGKNIIIEGPTGVGKSFLGSALGHQACMNGFRTLYFNAMKLFSQLKMAKGDGSYEKELKRIARAALVIIDDFGLQQLDTLSRLALLEILEDRHGRKSTIIISQLPVSKWHEVIGDPTIADAICDRIIHNAFRIELKGESVRKHYTEVNQ